RLRGKEVAANKRFQRILGPILEALRRAPPPWSRSERTGRLQHHNVRGQTRPWDRARRGLGSSLQINQRRGEMRKAILPVTLVVALAVGFAVVNATAKDKPKVKHGNTIHVIEHATTDSIDVDAVGHVLTFANDVFDSADHAKVGSDQGYCVRIVLHHSWECNWTTFLNHDQIAVEGPFSDDGNTVLAITGG